MISKENRGFVCEGVLGIAEDSEESGESDVDLVV